MNTDFVLVAQGGSTIPPLSIQITHSLAQAKVNAEQIVATLHKAGYFYFALYSVSSNHQLVARYRVENTQPLVKEI